MPRRSCSGRIAALASLAAIACAPPASRAPPTVSPSLTGAELGSAPNDEAVMRVTTARCERELACNKIGSGRAYEDQPTCLERLGALMDEVVGASACPAGPDDVAVSACLLEIQRTPCGGELERSTNLPACTRAALCRR